MSNSDMKVQDAYHPGLYLRQYLEEVQMSQDEFAKRLGISGKQVSLILNESASVTPDIAFRLSKLIGTSAELWLKLQAGYDMYLLELKKQEEFKKEKEIYQMIDKKYLKDLGILESGNNLEQTISNIRSRALISFLTSLEVEDIFCFHKTKKEKIETTQNIVCRNLWVSFAMSKARKIEVDSFNEKKILSYIDEFKSMTKQSFNDFYPKLKEMLASAGIAFVVLPYLKHSNTVGAVKWINSDNVMMAISVNKGTNDEFWFNFFHELKHILQKIKRKMIISNNEHVSELELIANSYALETLVPLVYIKEISKFDDNIINEIANICKVHPGIIVGRLQRENKIKKNQFNHLKIKYDYYYE